MDDFLECARLCEERGFSRQAELLRSVASGQRRAFVVVEVDSGYILNSGPVDGGESCAAFLDRDEADREAGRRNLRAFRERNFLKEDGDDDQDGPIYFDYLTDLDGEELSEQIGAILGGPFEFPEQHPIAMPIFPESATDDQMRAIMGLFTVRYYYVAEVIVAG